MVTCVNNADNARSTLGCRLIDGLRWQGLSRGKKKNDERLWKASNPWRYPQKRQPTNQSLPEVPNVKKKGCFDHSGPRYPHLCQRLDWLAVQAFQQIQHLSTVTAGTANVSSVCFPCRDRKEAQGGVDLPRVFLPKRVKDQKWQFDTICFTQSKIVFFSKVPNIELHSAFLCQNAAQLCTKDLTQILQIPGLSTNQSICKLECVSSIWQTLPLSRWCCTMLKKHVFELWRLAVLALPMQILQMLKLWLIDFLKW